MYPAFRPDKSYGVENPATYNAYIAALGDRAGFAITSFEKLLEAMSARIEYFHERGCRLSDHGLEQLYFFKKDAFSIDEIFGKVTSGQELSKQEIDFFKYTTLLH